MTHHSYVDALLLVAARGAARTSARALWASTYLREGNFADEVVAAALLHPTRSLSPRELAADYGEVVADLVASTRSHERILKRVRQGDEGRDPWAAAAVRYRTKLSEADDSVLLIALALRLFDCYAEFPSHTVSLPYVAAGRPPPVPPAAVEVRVHYEELARIFRAVLGPILTQPFDDAVESLPGRIAAHDQALIEAERHRDEIRVQRNAEGDRPQRPPRPPLPTRPEPLVSESLLRQFPNITQLVGFEGGAVYLADDERGFHVITDEAALADIQKSIDGDVIDSETRATFPTVAERSAYLLDRNWLPRDILERLGAG